MSDLKPCPFCGNTDVHIDADDGDFYAVLCDEGRCAGNSGYFGSPESAKACWNTRVSHWRSLKDEPPVPDAEWKESLRSILVRNPSRDHWYGRIVKLIRDGNTWRDDDNEDTWTLDEYVQSGCTEWMEIPE